MSEKDVVEVFVRVQDPEYYDRIILLVGAKFAEIFKVCETIKDGLKTQKKREDISTVSYEGRKNTRRSSSYQGRPRHFENSYHACYAQASYPNTPPPVYHNTTSTYPKPPSKLQKLISRLQRFFSTLPNSIPYLPK